MKIIIKSVFFLISFINLVQGQDDFEFDEDFNFDEEVLVTFNATRVISGHSVEVLPSKTFEMRIEHRFGDIAGSNGGYQTMFGFDNVSDMRIAL